MEGQNAEFSKVASELSALLVPFEYRLNSNMAASLALSKQQMEELEPVRFQFPNLWYDVVLSLQARRSGRHRVESEWRSDLSGR